MSDHSPMIDPLLALALRAGEAEMEVYKTDFDVYEKADESPVTDADRRAERLILQGLGDIAPDVPVVAEEAVSSGVVPDVGGGRFWLVDPLDGTKEFVKRNGEFTVNIGLIEGGEPVLGVVHAPAAGVTYWAYREAGQGRAFRQADGEAPHPIEARRVDERAGLVVVASRSHGSGPSMDAFLADKNVADKTDAGSSLKFCLVASGQADVYPRFGPTMEWDTAAGHAVLAAAGGSIVSVEGHRLTYGKPEFANPHIIAWGRRG